MTGPAGRPAPFVGRTEELAALDDAFDAASDGLVVALIGADPGVGKTALARACTARLRARSVPVHWGSCAEVGGAPAFWPWVQVLQAMGDGAAELAREALDAHADEPFAAYLAVHDVLQARADRPRVLVLDDLHAADLPSLELLRILATSSSDLPVLVIGTHRLHELRADPARDVLLAAVGSGGRRLHPGSLELPDVRSLLRAGTDAGPEAEADAGRDEPRDRAAADDLAAEVLARSGGNALYVEQLVEAVARGGVAALAEVPVGIRAAVRSRVAPLAAGTRRLLATAAVLAPGFGYDVLAAVAGGTPSQVRDALAPAVDAGLLADSGGGLAFTHALIREALGDELGARARAEAHAAAAAATGSRPDAVPAVVAQHLCDAGELADPVELGRWCGAAAAAARSVGGHREAARWDEEAARAWAAADDLSRQGAHLAAATSDWLTVGDGPRALALSIELADLARRAGSGVLLAHAAVARADVFEPVRDLEGPPLLREALAHPDLAEEPVLRADLLAGLAALSGMPSLEGFRRDGSGARAAITELEALAASGHPRILGRLAEARLNTESGPRHFEDRRRWQAEHARLRPPTANVLDRIQQLYWATSLAFEGGELADVDRWLGEWEVLAERSGSAYWTWRAAMARASLSYARGQVALAEEQAVAPADLVAALHPGMAFRVVSGLLFAIRRDQGRLHEVDGLEPASLGVLGVLLAVARQDLVEARRLLNETVAAAAATGPDDLAWLCLQSVVAVAAEAVGDAARCRAVADALDPFTSQCVMWGRSYVFGMPVAEAVGIARRGAGQPDEAAAAFSLARAWADRVGAVGFGARARVGLASVLPASEPERWALASEGRRTAQRLGFGGLVLEADAVLAATTAGPAGHTAAGDPSSSSSAPSSSPAPSPAAVGRSASVSAQVRTLGRFEVIGAGAVAPARWSSRKARDALKILICGQGRAIPREELIDHLWPTVDPVTGRSRLSVILSFLRTALDPEKRFVTDPLRADRQSVSLDLDLVAVDVEELLAHAAKGLRAGSLADPDPAELQEAALLAERGPFLAEDPYADFAAPLRGVVDRTHRDVLRTLARLAGEAGDAAGSMRWAARLVELDPHDRDARRRLVAELDDAGRHGEADRLRRDGDLGGGPTR